MFQVLYLILWYAVVNHVAAADYMGTVLVRGRPAGPGPALVGGVALAMLAARSPSRPSRRVPLRPGAAPGPVSRGMS